MNTLPRILFGIFLALAAGLSPVLAQEAPPASPGVEDLGWLAGSWSGEVRGSRTASRFEAHYTAPGGGMILGTSRAFGADGSLKWFEFERFEVREGLLQVTPYPNGTATDPFLLVEHDAAARKAVFANPGNDYPTRITYHRAADDRLVMILTGGEGAPVVEFNLSVVRP